MSGVSPNLAARPFFNQRPAKRASVFLWVLGVLLAGAATVLFWQHISGEGETSKALTEVEQGVLQERDRITELEQELREFNLTFQNDQIGYLNTKIAQRAFSWSNLFDRLAEVLPREVRLTRLTPRVALAAESRGRRIVAARPGQEVVVLAVDGVAQHGEALLEFIEELFSHPGFRSPNLVSEARQGSMIEFSLGVSYLPAFGGDRQVEKGEVLETTETSQPEPVGQVEPAVASATKGDDPSAEKKVSDGARRRKPAAKKKKRGES